jgi:hypothetical protein
MPTAQEEVLEPFASVGSGLPRLAELAEPMPHHERQLARVDRHLIEDALLGRRAGAHASALNRSIFT